VVAAPTSIISNQTVDHRTYLRPPKVADKLGVTIGTLANWRTKQIGPPHYRVGGLVLYANDEIDDWVAAGRQSTGDATAPQHDRAHAG
jgi:predicted DNA-binding transcriptional regulator AlpA